jgi:hypothetical protein
MGIPALQEARGHNQAACRSASKARKFPKTNIKYKIQKNLLSVLAPTPRGKVAGFEGARVPITTRQLILPVAQLLR